MPAVAEACNQGTLLMSKKWEDVDLNRFDSEVLLCIICVTASTGLLGDTWLNLHERHLRGECYVLMYPRSSCWSRITVQFILNIWFIMLQNAEMRLDQQSRSFGTINKCSLQSENNRNPSINLYPLRQKDNTDRGFMKTVPSEIK